MHFENFQLTAVSDRNYGGLAVCSIFFDANNKYLTKYPCLRPSSLETFQDFLIKLDIKPPMHLLKISIFSLKNVILRLTKIMNRADKNWAHF